MSRRTVYPTRHAIGPYRLVRYRQRRGYAIRDDRTGRPAWTEPHPVTGRPVAAMIPSLRAAYAIARMIAAR